MFKTRTPEQAKAIRDTYAKMLDLLTDDTVSGVPYIMISSLMGEAMEWDKWAVEIPYIPFKAGWQVKIIPPRTGAIVRFWVTTPELIAKHPDERQGISVYLDCYDALGMFGGPYWEVYPVAGDTERISMDDVGGLLAAIERGFATWEESQAHDQEIRANIEKRARKLQ